MEIIKDSYTYGMLTYVTTSAEQLDYVLEAENAPENRNYVSQWTREQHLQAIASSDHLHFLIMHDEKRVGYLILAGIESPHNAIELLRIVITVKGKGYGRSVLQFVKAFAFEYRHAHRLWLDVKDFNTKAYALYKSEGFVEEGRLREAIKRGEAYDTMILMAILRQEYVQGFEGE